MQRGGKWALALISHASTERPGILRKNLQVLKDSGSAGLCGSEGREPPERIQSCGLRTNRCLRSSCLGLQGPRQV